MEIQTDAHTPQSSWHWFVIVIVFLQILLMAAAFVGGRMLAGQNQRNVGLPGAAQLPSQLPKEPLAGSGTVQKIQSGVITLSLGGFGGGPPGQGGPAEDPARATKLRLWFLRTLGTTKVPHRETQECRGELAGDKLLSRFKKPT